MPNREWLPADYGDEVIPPCRAMPNEWIVQRPSGGYALAPNNLTCLSDNETPSSGRVLADGDIILFDWREMHGNLGLTFDADGGWLLDGFEPVASPGSSMLMAIDGDWDAAAFSLDDLCTDYSRCNDGPTETVQVSFWAWSDASEPFVFRSGAFVPPSPQSEIPSEEQP